MSVTVFQIEYLCTCVCVCVSCNMCLTQWRAVCDQNVCVVWDLVPLIQQSLTSRQVEAPAVVPGLPAYTHKRKQRHHALSYSIQQVSQTF